MAIRIVRLGTPRTPDEGVRLGTVRRPPRGVPKTRFSKDNWYDVWLPNLSPSAALLGAMPLALGSGVGSELRQPLGITIVGGLILSQMLTLFTTPVVYVYMDRLQSWLRSLFGLAPTPAHAPAHSD